MGVEKSGRRIQVFFRALAALDFAGAVLAGWLADFFLEPLKMRSHALENFSVEPVWTV